MKKIRFIVFFIAVISLALPSGAEIKVESSETVELMSIASRTASFREYCMDAGGQYTEDTEVWFAPYREHPFIGYFKSLRNQYGISYDAVMSMAINLEADDKQVRLVGDKQSLERRWKEVDLDTFLVKLNQFYTDTRFHEFYKNHQQFYDEVLRTYEANVMQYFHQDWYARFYGTEPKDVFHIVIGFTNGGGNYGPSRQLTGQPKEVFAICGYYVAPETEKAYENGLDYASTLIHEFNHSFVNYLYKNNSTAFDPIGEELYNLSEFSMNQQAYGNGETVVNESIVRAAVIMYMRDNGFSAEQIEEELYDQVSRGFHWMPELVNALQDYSKHRKRYPTLADYYPEIAKCLSKYTTNETKRIKKVL